MEQPISDTLFSNASVDVVVSLYNEEHNVLALHTQNKELEKFLNIHHFIYVDNGSTDQTGALLQSLSLTDPKIRIHTQSQNLGYGNGFAAGIRASTAELVLTNHADSQFNSVDFLTRHNTLFRALPAPSASPIAIIPERKSRPVHNAFLTLFLRIILSPLLTHWLHDFNGHPKILSRRALPREWIDFPKDFSFDLWLTENLGPCKILRPSVVQTPRHAGESSWNRGVASFWPLFRAYVLTAYRVLKKRHIKS